MVLQNLQNYASPFALQNYASQICKEKMDYTITRISATYQIRFTSVPKGHAASDPGNGSSKGYPTLRLAKRLCDLCVVADYDAPALSFVFRETSKSGSPRSRLFSVLLRGANHNETCAGCIVSCTTVSKCSRN